MRLPVGEACSQGRQCQGFGAGGPPGDNTYCIHGICRVESDVEEDGGGDVIRMHRVRGADSVLVCWRHKYICVAVWIHKKVQAKELVTHTLDHRAGMTPCAWCRRADPAQEISTGDQSVVR